MDIEIHGNTYFITQDIDLSMPEGFVYTLWRRHAPFPGDKYFTTSIECECATLDEVKKKIEFLRSIDPTHYPKQISY